MTTTTTTNAKKSSPIQHRLFGFDTSLKGDNSPALCCFNDFSFGSTLRMRKEKSGWKYVSSL